MYINRIGKISGQTVVYYVTANANDGFWYTWSSNQYFDAANADLVGGYSSPDYYNIFARFGGITIPAGATITDARLRLYKSNTNTATMRIFFNDTNTPTAPTSYSTANAKVCTTAYVDWTLPGQSGWATSPNVAAIIQALLNTPYTYSGTQYMQALIFGLSGAAAQMSSYEGGNAPILSITYKR